MTLKERYTIKNKKRMPQFIFLYSVLVVFFAMYSSFAKYEKISEGYVKIAVAQWKIALNGQELTSHKNPILENSILFIPVTGIDANDAEADSAPKIKPGQTGYFDIEIDPTGTEVSFEYQVTLDTSGLPGDFIISSYSLDGGVSISPLPENHTLGNAVSLGGKNIFTESDAQTIRYYWEWAGKGTENTTAVTVAAHVEVKQAL